MTRLRLRLIATGGADYPEREAETLGKAAAAVNDLTRDILFDLGLAVTRAAGGGGGGFPSGEVLRNAQSALAPLLDRSSALAATVSSIEGWRSKLVVVRQQQTRLAWSGGTTAAGMSSVSAPLPMKWQALAIW
ncbi:hypothetical protein [Streptomyces atratus]|uniref:hypothetical protein n=1 Tax=Streptomyces atratus TaxID=1893 RepID=UPI00365940E1